jgi:hypothetical protein
MLDFNEAELQREGGAGGAIPEDSIVPFKMTIRPPKSDKQSDIHPMLNKNSKGNHWLDVEFEALGSYGGTKFWQNFTVAGSESAAKISMRTLRAIVESGRGISPKDSSPAASEGRKLSDWADFNELTFLLKVGVEVTQNESTKKWYVNNTLKKVVTPDEEAYLAGEMITDKPLPALPAAGQEGTKSTTGPAPTGPIEGTTAKPAATAATKTANGAPLPDWAKR